jgi:DNA-binding winged helix-turn-helix (wHTH) protein
MSSNDAITRLHATVSALGDVDVSRWDDATLTDHLDELSAALCEVDTQLSRVADAVRARGFRISEPVISEVVTGGQIAA